MEPGTLGEGSSSRLRTYVLRGTSSPARTGLTFTGRPSLAEMIRSITGAVYCMKDQGASSVTEKTLPATLYNLVSLIFTNISKILEKLQFLKYNQERAAVASSTVSDAAAVNPPDAVRRRA